MASWIFNFPLPPSANERLTVVRGRMIKSKSHRVFRDQCHVWAALNARGFNQIKADMILAELEMKKLFGFASFRVDTFFAFASKNIAKVDADNRVKPLYDGLAAILGIDDRYFFAGNCEKVMTTSKELECSVIRIEPMRPRSLEEIRQQMLKENRTPAS